MATYQKQVEKELYNVDSRTVNKEDKTSLKING